MYGLVIEQKYIKKHNNVLFFDILNLYNTLGDYVKVKIFDLEDESDLEKEVNKFLESDIEVIDIKYSVSSSIFSEEQIFCFSAMIIYY